MKPEDAPKGTAGSAADSGEALWWQVLSQHKQHVGERRGVCSEQPDTQGASTSARDGSDGIGGTEEAAQQRTGVNNEPA